MEQARFNITSCEKGIRVLQFPLSFWDISLWLAFTAIILLVTTELISPYYGRTRLRISKKRLKNVALATSALFLTSAAMRIIEIIYTI